MSRLSEEFQEYFMKYCESPEAYEWLSHEACYRFAAEYGVCKMKETETQPFQTDFANLSIVDKANVLAHVTPSTSETIGATRRTLGWFITERLVM